MPEWNKIVHDLSIKYDGEVLFVIIDGNKNSKIRVQYKISGYPSFVIVGPGTDGIFYKKYNAGSE